MSDNRQELRKAVLDALDALEAAVAEYRREFQRETVPGLWVRRFRSDKWHVVRSGDAQRVIALCNESVYETKGGSGPLQFAETPDSRTCVECQRRLDSGRWNHVLTSRT